MMKTILDQMKEFADLGYYGEDYLSNTVDAAKDEIGTEKAAMYLAAPGFALQVEEAYPEMKDQIGIFLMPFGDNDVLANNASSAAYFINKKSENVEYALEFSVSWPDRRIYSTDRTTIRRKWDSAGRRSHLLTRMNSANISIPWKEEPSCR